ncbi:N,N-dimethylformamidase [Ruegeria sp. 2012CJ41-6]|uniref:N,N-dimethylformamidase n=1 Tax=Ruegeria spongiae TaxID=2942209 RepID=A0ABT0Q7I1_9RHOB|nr:N,N-dimethylformamidase beta subunit family domain-containing protein [Ruegeria spongiae]MCL6285834.1 N,N-dimethylformamidase [Ruegeria spongiae]
MLPIVGYTNKLTVEPGETIDVMVGSFGAKNYRADFRQIIQGDTNPDGPGYKDKLIDLDLGGDRRALDKPFRPGSCVLIPGVHAIEEVRDFTLAAVVKPTLLDGRKRSILALPGFAEIGIDEHDRLTGVAGGQTLTSTMQVSVDHWHIVSLSYCADTKALSLAIAQDRDSTSEPPCPEVVTVSTDLSSGRPSECIIAASRDDDGELTGFLDGRIDRPAFFDTAIAPETLRNLLADFSLLRRQRSLLGAWDFSRKMTTRMICDVSPYQLHGHIHNAPTRAMTGWLWKGQELDWKLRPDLYSAIHFHSTDMYDAGWEVDFSLTIPDDLKSGVYTVRLVPDSDEEAAYYCVFAVRPPRDRASGNTVAFLFPTCSYLAYANHRLGMDVPGTEIGMGRAVELDRHHMFLQDNPGIGFSVYETHDDDTGVFHSSRLRPIVDMQPKVKSFLGGYGSNIWQFNADTHILGWLDAIDQDYDVITDEDMHEDGLRLLQRYNVILTGTHPEYYTRNMMEAMQGFTDRGGRLMYLGGNGFYWVVSFNEDMPGIMECRRSEAGIRPWEPGHGHFYHGFTGEYGGLWRRNGHPPNHLCGVGMTSQGFDVSEPYVVSPEAENPRAAFIFDGIEGTRIGDFGLAGGGAAGLEVDRADLAQGTPEHALVLATSTRHTDIYLMTPEDLLDPTPDWSGTQADIIRADLTFFETIGGGAVFSTGSIAWAGSMAWNGYDNEIARMTENVLRRFDDKTPFEYPQC